MNENLKKQTRPTSNAPDQLAAPARGKRRKNYTKPQVVYQAPLEAMAATCTDPGAGKQVTPCTVTFS